MFVKAVNMDLSGKYGTKFDFGKTYNDIYFCDSAFATCEYYKNPNATRYLIVSPIDLHSQGDGHSFFGSAKIEREMSYEEVLLSMSSAERTHFIGRCNRFKE